MEDRYPIPDMADVELVDVLRALADPVRLDIVRLLGDGEPHLKSDCVAERPDLHKSTYSHHFKTLREAGVTRMIVEGRSHQIRLRKDELAARFPGLLDSVLAQGPTTLTREFLTDPGAAPDSSD
ncbi:DNA-binding transcriptional ArsR family regulator [Diaminobutyricimonas aerilata]|uniref:DNA-binding transcriptional ArsR family regulator n=2 Tax=Diaminobutyricimonas aerilata TaxID=1162967 RepID=A0A2M9CGC9_9MICO|nr:DNA-binding transcriptional ArsR family regulator [Diaminobutyricimonas aerilata]